MHEPQTPARLPKVPAPTVPQIVGILKAHPLIKLRETVQRAFIVGSVASGLQEAHSDVGVLLEVEPRELETIETAEEMEIRYRLVLQRHLKENHIKGVADHLHPQWSGRRVVCYFTYDADKEMRPKVQLHPHKSVDLPVPAGQ